MSRINNPNQNHHRISRREWEANNVRAANRLRSGVSRSRSRNNGNAGNGRGGGSNSQRHHGRDLLIATGKLVDRRIEEYPNQGLSKVDERLYCQPCDKFIHHKKTNVRRHIGMSSVSVQQMSFFVFLV